MLEREILRENKNQRWRCGRIMVRIMGKKDWNENEKFEMKMKKARGWNEGLKRKREGREVEIGMTEVMGGKDRRQMMLNEKKRRRWRGGETV